MRLGGWTSLLTMLVLFSAEAVFGNGTAVLDSLQDSLNSAQTAITNATNRLEEINTRLGEIKNELRGATGAQKKALKAEQKNLKSEAKALNGGMKKAQKAVPLIENAIESLKVNDINNFTKYVKKAISSLAAARKKGGANFGLGAVDEAIAVNLGTAAQEARDSVDASDPKRIGAADKAIAKGNLAMDRGKIQKAAVRYLSAFRKLANLPVAMMGAHQPIQLLALNGAVINLGISVVPYSPKQTCGACHNYALITEGFHFDQGRRDISDDYSIGKGVPDYVLSDGMFGRW